MKKPSTFWRVEVFEGGTRVSALRIPANQIAYRQGGITVLLQMLVAKHALEDDEIASALLYKRYRTNHLEVRRSYHSSFTYTCGGNVHAVAVLTDADGRPIPTPSVQ